MIMPTIGRIMWYWPMKENRSKQPWAAIVTHVYGDNMVNLVAFSPYGAPYPVHSVPIVQDSSPHIAGDSHYAEWMPYQIGQAKKHEGETKA